MSTSSQAPVIPIFKMSRDIVTVKLAWEEYRYGRISPNTGQRTISIQELDEKYGSKWRGPKSSTEGTFYRRRESLWVFVQKAIQQNSSLSEAAAVERIELARGNRSLRSIGEQLATILARS